MILLVAALMSYPLAPLRIFIGPIPFWGMYSSSRRARSGCSPSAAVSSSRVDWLNSGWSIR
ncbi:MAG: hypothetical protein L6W00_08210 [Lentisphaeria bacterium]|nr:MAG: hypothetical protein L6W00_08210 [Lentisphaeria bacterium]